MLFLLAKAFLWQNRWLTLAFAAWPLLMGAFLWSPHKATNPADVTEIVQQEMFYGAAVIAFLAASAIHNERRSRRIVTVLSKAVSRSQYLFGLLLGIVAFALAYYAMVAIVFLLLAGGMRNSGAGAASLLLTGIVAALWCGSLALTLSTFLHPLLAGSLAAAAAFAPLAIGHHHSLLLPLASLIADVNPYSYGVSWIRVVVVCIESTAFFVLGAQIFARRDLSAAVD